MTDIIENEAGEAMGFTPSWWTFVLLGIIAFIFGICCVIMPGYVTLFLGYFIGAMVVVWGIMTVVQAVKPHEGGTGRSVALIILGVLAIILGLLVFSSILSAWFLITYLIAFWAFLTGFTNIFQAFTGKDSIWYKVLLVIAGIIAIILGFYVMMYPLMATATVIYVLGIFLIAWGVIVVITGLMTQK
ncbi:HdeD family acid-resistance protein [Methanogenium sp. MK-MG]|uniref:HdeD family acid-resistance protein n=1 Tax=Methanogenium sp. MK-MG TaxID=2599926 RepID=UPI0013E9F9A0|nr:DUF308 domain-containing protein [Methanogenium sp. MK-MG]KAF1075754.1 hypothetical protein MKMG_01668 [Methanogenium sp. MK-MG]